MTVTLRAARRTALASAAVLVAASSPGALVAQAALTCEACHGELEFLRQQTSTLEEARELHVPGATVEASAHSGIDCSVCHRSFARFPHGTDAGTTPCTGCHADQRAAWEEGIHAVDGNAECSSCHGIHDVLTSGQLREPDGVTTMRSACSSCHFEPRMPAGDPHASGVACASCHEPHRTLGIGNPEASIYPQKQAETCGQCHEAASASWSRDTHGRAVGVVTTLENAVTLEEVEAHLEPPSCTGCHGAHGMLTPSAPDFPREMAARCSHCHEEYSESFADSYHGQATELGSGGVATCYHCHGSHTVLPSADPLSAVGEANLLATCQTCHPSATAGFALFQPHADHNDREKYPMVYWSYHLMTALLIGVFTVFGAHTVLWLLRLGLDAVRGNNGHPAVHGD